MKTYCAPIYGMGGSMLDPAGGMATLFAKIRALGIEGPSQPFQEEDILRVVAALKSLPNETKIFIIGDSCGANRAPYVAAAIRPAHVAYMACIQASIYCTAGCPPIGDNVDEAHIFYSDWAHTEGLGTYIPVCQHPPNNNGKTLYRQSYVPAVHPDDNDVLRVHIPILNDIKRVMSQ